MKKKIFLIIFIAIFITRTLSKMDIDMVKFWQKIDDALDEDETSEFVTYNDNDRDLCMVMEHFVKTSNVNGLRRLFDAEGLFDLSFVEFTELIRLSIKYKSSPETKRQLVIMLNICGTEEDRDSTINRFVNRYS